LGWFFFFALGFFGGGCLGEGHYLASCCTEGFGEVACVADVVERDVQSAVALGDAAFGQVVLVGDAEAAVAVLVLFVLGFSANPFMLLSSCAALGCLLIFVSLVGRGLGRRGWLLVAVVSPVHDVSVV
jgi:hypothetical protein